MVVANVVVANVFIADVLVADVLVAVVLTMRHDAITCIISCSSLPCHTATVSKILSMASTSKRGREQD